RGLSYIWTSNNSKLDLGRLLSLDCVVKLQVFENGIEQISDPCSMFGRDGTHFEAELVELARLALDGPRFNLIRGDDNRLSRVPEQNAEFFIQRCHAGP